ncbi:MAG TPA: geranylgeranyl reductase family protein [Acidimicrobiales bacterium]|nr:geranylgeranyl reductase family protein [Acidimicrobiales bacterium]
MPTRQADVVVVGAGPAGACTAFHLSALGYDVVIVERAEFPRDKTCGDGLTWSAVQALENIGALSLLAAPRRIDGVRFAVDKRSRVVRYSESHVPEAHGLVVPRVALDAAVLTCAVEAGARVVHGELRNLVLSDERVEAQYESPETGAEAIRARVVVGADGARSRVAALAGLGGAAVGDMGLAMRVYADECRGLDDLLHVYMPITRADGTTLASYGWAFPVSDHVANVGVGVYGSGDGRGIGRLLTRFVEQLRQADDRFSSSILRQQSARAAPLRFDFIPGATFGDAVLLVGDAAGMVSPFTGEGISFALESAAIAADSIDQYFKRRALDLSIYATKLGRAYAAYFEAGRRAAKRFRITWNVIRDSFDSDRPIFDLVRQGALYPELLGGGPAGGGAPLEPIEAQVAAIRTRLGADLIAVSELLIDATRAEWPALAKAIASAFDDPRIPFRPAVLLLLASYMGEPGPGAATQVATAALELGHLAVLCHFSVEDLEDRGGVARRDWSNKVAALLGDYLLARSAELLSSVGDTGSDMADHMAAMMLCRLEQGWGDARPRSEDYVSSVVRLSGELFRLPCALGAKLAQLPTSHSDALESFGSDLGVVWHLTDEIRTRRGLRTHYVQSVAGGLHDRIDLPLLLAAEQAEGVGLRPWRELMAADRLDVRAFIDEHSGLADTQRLVKQFGDSARRHLASLPLTDSVSALARIVDYAVRRGCDPPP